MLPTVLLFLSACYFVDNEQGLDELVRGENVIKHLQELDRIAEEHNKSRASGTPGFESSLKYIKSLLDSRYILQEQKFIFRYFKELEDMEMKMVMPEKKQYEYNEDFSIAKYSGSGQLVDVEVVAVDIVMPPGPEANTSDSGCQIDDFYDEQINLVDGRIALIQRGTCACGLKAANAQNAGAVGVIIYNEGQKDRQSLTHVTLGSDSEITIPVVFTSYAIGEEIYHWTQSGRVRITIIVNALDENRTAMNLLAETLTGREDFILMAGAHLDSVETPGINDNGSGSATLLEIALQMYMRGSSPENKVRFAFWGGEELGLLGSTYYIEGLSQEEQHNIQLYLNFDILGSPNYVRFVYDSDGDKPKNNFTKGSEEIEKVFYDYFQKKYLEAEPIDLTGMSDHMPFMRIGIPVGGLFSGASGKKTMTQALTYGGTQGEPYDACYHQPCDDILNINLTVLDELSKAAAYAVDYFSNVENAIKKHDLQEEKPIKQTHPHISKSAYIGPLLYR